MSKASADSALFSRLMREAPALAQEQAERDRMKENKKVQTSIKLKQIIDNAQEEVIRVQSKIRISNRYNPQIHLKIGREDLLADVETCLILDSSILDEMYDMMRAVHEMKLIEARMVKSMRDLLKMGKKKGLPPREIDRIISEEKPLIDVRSRIDLMLIGIDERKSWSRNISDKVRAIKGSMYMRSKEKEDGIN